MAIELAQVQRTFKKLRKSIKKLPSRPEPEQVHKLRTRSRRVESLLEALGLNDGLGRRLQRQLKRVRRKAGTVRDLDVLTSDLCDLDIHDDDTCRVQLVEYFGAERFKKADKLHRVVVQKRRKLRRLLKVTLKQVETSATRERKQKRSKNLNVVATHGGPSAHAMSLALDLASELGATPVMNRGNLHEYRKQIKRLRYVLEIAGERDDTKELVDQLKRTQDAIGDWHDWLVLGEIASDVLSHPNCRLIAVIRAHTEAKYDAALKLAEQVRARLREQDHETGMAASKKQPRSTGVSRRMSIAASALAA